MRDRYIKATVGGTSRSTAKIMRTGQTTSFRTGDDADLLNGRDVDFFTLAEDNPFGNTNRFTDELGGQTYSNLIVIDWSTYDGSTVFGYYNNIGGANISWNDSIDNALAVSVGSYTSGWFVPNILQLYSIINWQLSTNKLNYAPFNYVGATGLWTSNTLMSSTTQAVYVFLTTGTSGNNVKTATTVARFIASREFTVTGTTLT